MATFTNADIEKMRKDTLTLLKAAEKESSYDEALEIRDAINIFLNHLDSLFYKKMAPSIENKDAEKGFRSKTWAFYIGMSMPLWPDDHVSKEIQYRRWQEQKPKWLSSVKRKARIAWSAIKDTFLSGSSQREIEDSFSDTVQLEGFRVVFLEKPSPESVNVIKASLKIAREGLDKVFPKALQRKPVLVFEKQGLDKGGQFEAFERRVILNLNQFNKWVKNPKACAQIIVHELAHDLYNFLSDEDRSYWRAAIVGDYGSLKLSELIKEWPEDMAEKSLYRLGESLRRLNPILALKIQMLTHYQHVDYRNRKQAEEALKTEDKVFSVPNSPISPYANSRPEEAFCEAFSYYTVYGQQAVLPIVRVWLRTILPAANIVVGFSSDVKAKWKIVPKI